MSARTILVIEDNDMSMELVVDLLELAGYRVLKEGTAEAGIRAATARQPDLILMDLALPRVDGTEATRRLAQDPRTARIPVVALTAQVTDQDIKRALTAGCCGIITKPIDTRSFAMTVAGFFVGDAAPETAAAGDGTGRG
jgi:two-component system cell cycle response regulator DivK